MLKAKSKRKVTVLKDNKTYEVGITQETISIGI